MVTEPDPVSSELLQACLARIRELLAAFSRTPWPVELARERGLGTRLPNFLSAPWRRAVAPAAPLVAASAAMKLGSTAAGATNSFQ